MKPAGMCNVRKIPKIRGESWRDRPKEKSNHVFSACACLMAASTPATGTGMIPAREPIGPPIPPKPPAGQRKEIIIAVLSRV